MIWTAIFTDKSHLVFSTQLNCEKQAKEYLNQNTDKLLFTLIKGSHHNFYF